MKYASLYSSKISKIELCGGSWWNLAGPYRETTHPCKAFLQTEISQAKSGNYRYAQFRLSKHLTFPDLSTSEDKIIFLYHPYLG